MGKDVKPVPRTGVVIPVADQRVDPFKQFLRESLDRVVVENSDVNEVSAQVRVNEQQRLANIGMDGRPKELELAPVGVRPPNPLLEKAMERRFLPIAGMTGNEVPQVEVREGVEPLLVEAHKLIGDLLAGRMINVSSPIVWGRVKATQERLRVAISVPVATTKES